MAGYLDHYGAGEEKRENILKWLLLSALFLAIFGPLSYYLFKNHSQEGEVRKFLSLLRANDQKTAYASWGCTEARPCPNYPYTKFLEDWGPNANVAAARISDSESCNAGVIITVDKPEKQEMLWVEKNSPALGFSPFPYCPNKSPLSNMIHQTVGKLRKPFLN